MIAESTKRLQMDVPEVGSLLTVLLPDELTRSHVLEVMDNDHIKVKLDIIPPMAKSHRYVMGDTVLAVRDTSGMQEKWRVTRHAPDPITD